jgi:hypothetical protein
MKIIFKQDFLKRKLKKDQEYLIIHHQLYYDCRSFTILNDDKYPIQIFIYNKDLKHLTIIDNDYLYGGSHELDCDYEIKETDIAPLVPNLYDSKNKYFFEDLYRNKCWAIKEFSRKLMDVGIDVNDDFKNITVNDAANFAYVQAEINALFLGICNFFAGCRDMQFQFRFDKHNVENISLQSLVNTSFCENNRLSLLVDADYLIDDWVPDLQRELYDQLTIYSDFGHLIKNNNLEEDEDRERTCLKTCIEHISLALESIFMDVDSLKVYKIPFNKIEYCFWGQYCLIFETPKYFYRFYLGNYD